MDKSNEKKRRGRKAKIENIIIEPDANEKIPKKRGRKPKGGKIITQNNSDENINDQKINVVLHLKCNKSNINNIASSNMESYQFNAIKNTELTYMDIKNTEEHTYEINYNKETNENTDSIKHIYNKLEKLSTQLHIGTNCDKKSACFHCTCEFDNIPIYIPKFQLDNIFHVYGCFCSPECACAYLMNEKNIDATARNERYYLLNYIYCKIYDYEKNIKPAPCPYYTLDKFYGSLTIQEYRKLLKNERLLLVVDKPLIRSMPELHDDSEDYLLNNKGIPAPTQKYNLQKYIKTPSKNEILNEQFNIKS